MNAVDQMGRTIQGYFCSESCLKRKFGKLLGGAQSSPFLLAWTPERYFLNSGSWGEALPLSE